MDRRKSHRNELAPTPGLVKGTQHQNRTSILFAPEDGRAFEPQIDDTTNRAFDGAAADGQIELCDAVIGHMRSVFHKIVELGANGPAVASSTEATNGLDDLVNLSLMKQLALVVEPAFAHSEFPILAQCSNSTQMFDSMKEVNQEMDLLGGDVQGLEQGRYAIPDPDSAIADEQELVGLLNVEFLQVRVLAGKRSAEQRVHPGRSKRRQSMVQTVDVAVPLHRLRI